MKEIRAIPENSKLCTPSDNLQQIARPEMSIDGDAAAFIASLLPTRLANLFRTCFELATTVTLCRIFHVDNHLLI
jgi:hypothetical protein